MFLLQNSWTNFVQTWNHSCDHICLEERSWPLILQTVNMANLLITCPFLPETGERRERRCPWFSYLLIRKLIYSLVPNDTLYGRLTHTKKE